jgi:hypothetical protein
MWWDLYDHAVALKIAAGEEQERPRNDINLQLQFLLNRINQLCFFIIIQKGCLRRS